MHNSQENTIAYADSNLREYSRVVVADVLKKPATSIFAAQVDKEEQWCNMTLKVETSSPLETSENI
jgi:hypothetical protein